MLSELTDASFDAGSLGFFLDSVSVVQKFNRLLASGVFFLGVIGHLGLLCCPAGRWMLGLRSRLRLLEWFLNLVSCRGITLALLLNENGQ